MARNKIKPWERQEYETAHAYSIFAAYRDLGRDEKEWILPLERRMSIREFGEKINKSKHWLHRLSFDNHWQDRLDEYDTYIVSRISEQHERDIAKMNKNQATIGQQMQTVALKGLLSLAPEDLTASDVGNLAEKGAKMERTARGISSEVTTVKTEMSGDLAIRNEKDIDLSKLTDEELHAYAKLTEKLLGD